MNRINYKNLYYIWLKVNIILIALMVVLGGYTRLTGSGLSITEWNLISGILPPLTEVKWQEIFQLYQQIPQYKEINFAMNLNDFKQIFWLEYLHRLLGRLIGLSIIIPGLFLYFSKYAEQRNKCKISLYIILVLIQGVIGWLMVASGLSELTSVSHYRLALHLFTAFILFALISIDIVKLNNVSPIKYSKHYVKLYIVFYLLLIWQIIYGAFVAGLDAGYIYNDFPLMGKTLYPSEISFVTISEFFFTNIATIQFIHRVLAILLVITAILLMFKNILQDIFGQTLIILLFIQFLLGIATLITVVNIHLAVLHQLFALLLFTNATIYMVKIKDNGLLR